MEKTFKNSIQILFIVCAIVISFGVKAQQPSNPATPKPSKEQVALNRAEANQAKIERKIAVADSLMTVGNATVEENQALYDQNQADRKTLDKEYAAKSKELNKALKSKDAQEVAAAKAELKQTDLDYKNAAKKSDTEMKALLKKIDTGLANVNKGKTIKKESSKALKDAQKATAAAEKAVNGPEPKKGKK